MSKPLVLVTGATGMIGYAVLLRLLQAGYQVRCAVRSQASFDRMVSLAPTQPYLSQLSNVIVPDITVAGCYDEAVAGDVTYVVHVASPIPTYAEPDADDFELTILRPAVRGTINMLEAAAKQASIKRVVITGSMGSLTAYVEFYERMTPVTEDTRAHDFTRPFASEQQAYLASKTLAFQAAKDFMAQNQAKATFDVVHILPAFVIGRDETVTDPKHIAKGSNGCLMASLLGLPRPILPGAMVHLDDIAEMHLQALDTDTVPGGHDFLGCCIDNEPVHWTDAYDIVKRRFPDALDAGLIKLAAPEDAATFPTLVSNKKAREIMGIKFKSYEEQVVSLVEHYLELVGRAQQ